MFSLQELRYLIVGGTNLTVKNPNPCSWLSLKQWVAIEELSQSFQIFRRLDQEFEKDS